MDAKFHIHDNPDYSKAGKASLVSASLA